MILKLVTGFLLKPLFLGVAVVSFLIGSFLISEQSSGPLGQYIAVEGRDAVILGTSLLAVGTAFIIFYLASWMFTMPLVVIGILLIVSGLGLGTIDASVSSSALDSYLLDPVSGVVNTLAKPIIDQTVKPLLEIVEVLGL